MTRIKSEIWVKGYVRRCYGENCPAVIVRRGDDDAGAIFIKVNRLDGHVWLYGPAPAGFTEVSTERQWIALFEAAPVPEEKADSYLARQFEFDPDVWLIELESPQGVHFLDDWLKASSDPTVPMG